MKKKTIGVISDDLQGIKLAELISGHGFSVAYMHVGFDNMTAEEQNDFITGTEKSGFSVMPDNESFLLSLEEPRKIFMISRSVVLNGDFLITLLESLNSGDTLVNMCDMDFIDAQKICAEQRERGVNYLPTGYCGGVITPDVGLSALPSGVFAGYEAVKPVFSEISARDEDGFMCSPYIGPDGSGQFVKMVFNGLEYAMLEIYSEAISLIKAYCTDDQDDIVELLSDMRNSEADSFILEVLTDICSRYDRETGKAVTELVSDRVEYGKSVQWAVKESLGMGVPLSMVYSALEIRLLSQMKNERVASSRLTGNSGMQEKAPGEMREFNEMLRSAIYISVLCALAQSFAFLRKASEKYVWDLDFVAIARTIQINSLSRSRALSRTIEAIGRNNKIVNLFNDPYFRNIASQYTEPLKKVLALAADAGITAGTMQCALNYMITYSSSKMDSGIIQLARDYLHADGFERSDTSGRFQANWDKNERLVDLKKSN